MATEADHGTPTAPDAAAEAAPAAAAPEAAPAGTAPGTEAPALDIDATAPAWEPTGQLADAPPELAAKIAEAVQAHSEGALAKKVEDMTAGYNRQIQKLSDAQKAAETSPEIDPELQANAEAYLALLDDPDGIHELAAKLKAGDEPAPAQEDLAARLLAGLKAEGFDEDVGGSLAKVLGEFAAELKGAGGDPSLAAEVQALKQAQVDRDAAAAQDAQAEHFAGLEAGWDKELGLGEGAAHAVFEGASTDNSPEMAAKSLLVGKLTETGKIPVAALHPDTVAAVIKADQDRIIAATNGTTPAALAPGASPAAPPGKPQWDADAPPGSNHARAKQIVADRKRGR